MLNNFDKDVQTLYESMVAECEKEIQSFYQKYAKNQNITIAEAKKRVSSMDVKGYESTAERLVKTGNLTAKAREELKLYNATMKINRLRMLEANIGLHLVNGYSDLERMTGQKLTDETVAEYKRQAGILGNTVQDVETRAKNLVNQSFKNATWNERIWTNQTALRNTLSTELMKGLIGGKSSATIAANIRKQFDVSSMEAKRLARTELVRCQTGAQIDSYKEHGWKGFEFLAYGSRSCEVCQQLNGKHFPITDFLPAENAPPMHPNCRCRTAPYEDEEEYQRWLDSFGSGNSSVLFAGDDILKGTDRVYTESEINRIARRTFDIANKYIDNKSKWSGNIIINDELGRCAKLWNCDITTTSNTAPHMILHEQIHAHSISYYDVQTYAEFHKIEEASVQLMAQEISKREGIEIIHSQYDEMVDALRIIREKLEIGDSDLAFAKMLIEMPVSERIDWIEERIYNWMVKNGTIKDFEEINLMVEKVR